ncbi:MAG: type II secretion system F family protein [Planctomycetaceae bacterium]|nr:type II secretion system F family protein [Planctomycetaceae bacterium]
MDTTYLLYFGMLAVLIVAAIYLIVRDLNAAKPSAAADDETPRLSTLPFAGEQTVPDGMSERFDYRFRELIYQSGIDIVPEAAFLVMVFCGLVTGGGVFLWRDDLLMAVLAFVPGFVAPYVYYVVRRNGRMKMLRELLPGSMETISRAVRAGETLDQAIDVTGKSTMEPLGVEWRRTARHLDMGLSMPAAMKSMTKRAPLMELRILSTALNVQRRTGGNLGATLDRLSHVIRDRLSYQRSFQAATGASRMATILIALAGPLVFTYMMIFQPDYMGQFFNLPGGTTLLAVAGVLQVIGLTWVFGLLRNDY